MYILYRIKVFLLLNQPDSTCNIANFGHPFKHEYYADNEISYVFYIKITVIKNNYVII